MRAGAGHVLLSLALASLVPVLFLSTSIKQLKHSLLCKQSLVGFMELRVTMCLSPGPSPCGLLEMQFSLSFGACPSPVPRQVIPKGDVTDVPSSGMGAALHPQRGHMG